MNNLINSLDSEIKEIAKEVLKINSEIEKTPQFDPKRNYLEKLLASHVQMINVYNDAREKEKLRRSNYG